MDSPAPLEIERVVRGTGSLHGEGVRISSVAFELKLVRVGQAVPGPRQGGRETRAPVFGRIQLPVGSGSPSLLGTTLHLDPLQGPAWMVTVTRMLRPAECLVVATPAPEAPV